MPRAFRGVLLAATVALLLTVPILAQSNTGNVYGNVIDETGASIPGGTAVLTGPSAPHTTSVDAQGFFRFLKVPPGKYSLTVTMPGFTTVTRDNVLVTLGQNTQADVQLKLSSVAEAVTVTSATPLLDTRKVETGQTFNKDQLTEIPTSRDIWSLIAQVPGVQIDTVNVAGNQSGVAGGPDFISKGSGNVVYQVDGATVTDNTYGSPLARQNGGTNTFFDFSTFDNVEVSTGGSVLEQQNSGVTINVVTKRGTNELKGSARYMYASGNWQSNNVPQEALDQGLATNNTRFIREYGGDLGGPIVKDRLWLWAAGSRQDINTNVATFSSSYGTNAFPESTTLEPWSAKLNAQVTDANAAALYYNRSNRIQHNRGAAPDRTPESLTSLLIPTNFYKAEDSHVFSSDLFASIFLSYQNPDYTSNPNGGLDQEIDYYANAQYPGYAYFNTWNYFYAKDPQKQANMQVSKFFNTGKINHELKFSFNYRQQTADSASGLPGTQNQGNEYSYSALLSRGVRTVYSTQYWSGTLGDTLTAGNLTVQAGVRYDLQQGKNLPSHAVGNTSDVVLDPANPFPLPSADYHGSNTWQFSYPNWQPRVSATYALGEKKNTLLRASYARFADQLGYIVYYGNGVPISSGYYYYWLDNNGNHHVDPGEVDFNTSYGFYNGIDPAKVGETPPNQIQPKLKTPSTTEWTAGVDHQFMDNLAVSGTFSYRNTTNLQSGTPIGTTAASYDYIGNATGSATATGNGFTINFNEPFYGLNLAETPQGDSFGNRPGASQRYYGVDLSIVKRLSDKWMLRGNFGWNSFKQYLTAQSIQNPNNFWYSFGQGTGQNCNGCPAVGYSSKDSVFINANWQFNVSGLYQGPWGLNFGVNFFGRQGFPNPYYVRVSTYDVASNRPRILIGQVDSHRYDNVYQLDFRLQKSFQVGPLQIIPTAEIFNVTNANTVLQRYERVGDWRDSGDGYTLRQSFYFNDIIEVQSPRILRLGINVNF